MIKTMNFVYVPVGPMAHIILQWIGLLLILDIGLVPMLFVVIVNN